MGMQDLHEKSVCRGRRPDETRSLFGGAAGNYADRLVWHFLRLDVHLYVKRGGANVVGMTT